MTDYTKLVEALRCTMKHEKVICAITECSYNKGKRCKALPFNRIFHDAADAIEALNHLVDLNMERCEGLRKQLREAQEQYEKHLNELEKELSFSESTYEEFQIVAATQNALLAKQLPKRGEWVVRDTSPITFRIECSVCGADRPRNKFDMPYEAAYCPSCGAKMEVQDGN